MLDLLSKNTATFIVAAVVAAAVVLIIVSMIRSRKKPGTSCRSACAGCPNACHCHHTEDR